MSHRFSSAIHPVVDAPESDALGTAAVTDVPQCVWFGGDPVALRVAASPFFTGMRNRIGVVTTPLQPKNFFFVSAVMPRHVKNGEFKRVCMICRTFKEMRCVFFCFVPAKKKALSFFCLSLSFFGLAVVRLLWSGNGEPESGFFCNGHGSFGSFGRAIVQCLFLFRAMCLFLLLLTGCGEAEKKSKPFAHEAE